ncbi:hypothetical protein ACFX13_007785 [Malus domestica]
MSEKWAKESNSSLTRWALLCSLLVLSLYTISSWMDTLAMRIERQSSKHTLKRKMRTQSKEGAVIAM